MADTDLTRRALLSTAAIVWPAGSALAAIGRGVAVPGVGGGSSALPLVRTFNQPTGTSTPANAFWSVGHPFASGEVPSGNIVTATLGGTSVPLQAIARKLHNDGSLAWAQLLVDLSGITITTGSSKDLVLTPVAGSWSGASGFTNSGWTALVDTVELSSMTASLTSGSGYTTGTGSPSDTWIATFDGGATNTIEVYGDCSLGRWVKVIATLKSGATTHNHLDCHMDYWVTKRAGGAAGDVYSHGPFVRNINIYSKSSFQLYTYNLAFKRNGVTQRSFNKNPHVCSIYAAACRADGLGDWSANDPLIWVGADYTKTRKTKKIPPFADSVSYGGANSVVMESYAIASVSGGTLTFNHSSGGAGGGNTLFGEDGATTAVDFFGAAVPAGLSAGTVYWAKRLTSTTFDVYPTLTDANASTNRISPTTAGTSATVRNSVAPMTPGIYRLVFGGAGGSPVDLALIAEAASAYHVANTQGYQRLGRVQAVAQASIPGAFLLNDATGRIPSWIDAGNTPAGLGTAKTTSGYNPFGTGGISSDINGGSIPSGGTNGWSPDNHAHWPSGVYGVWLMEGGTFFRDCLIYEASNAIGSVTYTPKRNFVLGGTTYYGTIVTAWNGENARSGAWLYRSLIQGYFAATQGSDEETYLGTVIANNVAQWSAYKTYKGANFSSLGFIHYDEGDFPPAAQTIDGMGVEGFMQTYMQIVSAFAAILIGDRISVGALADDAMKLLNNYYNSSFCAYFGTTYCFNPSASDAGTATPGSYQSTITEVGLGATNDLLFDYALDGTVTWRINGGGTVLSMMATAVQNDKFRPTNYTCLNGTLLSPAASPPEVTDGTDYYMIAPTQSNTTGTFKIATTPSGTPITFAATHTGCGGTLIPAAQSCSASSSIVGPTGDSYLSWQKAAAGMHAVRGSTNSATVYSAAATRFTDVASYGDVCSFAFQGTV